jgi:hypothetical protein
MLMKRLFSALIFTSGLLLSQGAQAQGWAPPAATFRVGIAPPVARIEVRPMQPTRNHFWMEGHWGWNGASHIWTPGRWEVQRVGHVWIGPRWSHRGGYWHFVPGHWRPADGGMYGQPVYAPQPQPVYAQPPQPVYAQPPQPVYQPQPQPVYQPPQPEYGQPEYAQPEYGQPMVEEVVVQQPPPPPRVEVIGVAPSVNHFWVGGYWGWYGGRHVWNPGRWEVRRAGHHWIQPGWGRHGGGWRYNHGGWRRW